MRYLYHGHLVPSLATFGFLLLEGFLYCHALVSQSLKHDVMGFMFGFFCVMDYL